MNSDALTTEKLREFDVFSKLPEDLLTILAGRLTVHTAEVGAQLFEVGDIDSWDILLLEGVLNLVASDGRSHQVSANAPVARAPIARFRPRNYTGECATKVAYLKVDRDLLEELNRRTGGGQSMDVSFGVVEDEPEAPQDLLSQLRKDLNSGRVKLTSIPEVALKIRSMLSSDDVSVPKVAEMINRDPVIAAKILKAANSPIYLGSAKCETVQNAVVRLGLLTTRQLVLSFTLNDLFQSQSKILKGLMLETWNHSIDVAAISFVLAQYFGKFSPEEAMLGGLLSNIGVISVINYAESHPQLCEDEQILRAALKQFKAEVGAMVLEEWEFPSELVECAKGCEDWERCPTSQADLCDLVLVATLHSFIGKPYQADVPRIDQTAAYTKLSQGGLGPELTLTILDQAREQIEAARQLLVG